MKINVNTEVEVTLTSQGREVYANYAEKFNRYPDVKLEMLLKLETNKLKMPLWEVMHIFGQHLYMGGLICFQDNAINFLEING